MVTRGAILVSRKNNIEERLVIIGKRIGVSTTKQKRIRVSIMKRDRVVEGSLREAGAIVTMLESRVVKVVEKGKKWLQRNTFKIHCHMMTGGICLRIQVFHSEPPK